MIRLLFLRENQTLAMVHDKAQIPRLGLGLLACKMKYRFFVANDLAVGRAVDLTV